MGTRASQAHEKRAASPDEISMRVLRRFRVVFNQVKTHFRRVERAAGISGAQAWALSVVGARPGLGTNALAEAMDVHQSTASNLVRGLVARQLLVSEHGAEDRREVQLHLTAKGRKALLKAPEPLAGVLPEALRRLDAPTLARLDRDLARLVKELGGDGRAGSIPLGSPD